jgi:hypothetical protein
MNFLKVCCSSVERVIVHDETKEEEDGMSIEPKV